MPSPLAHASLTFLARPLLARQPAVQMLPRRRRWAFYGLIAFALCAADLDFALTLVSDHPMHGHGTYLHSLAAAIVFAPLFGFVGRWLLKRTMTWAMLTLIGFIAYSSHLLLDLFTPGRGIMLMFPFSTERYVSPMPLFFGAHHSQPWAWQLHLITLVTELAFVGLVWLLARRWMPTHRPTPATVMHQP